MDIEAFNMSGHKGWYVGQKYRHSIVPITFARVRSIEISRIDELVTRKAKQSFSQPQQSNKQQFIKSQGQQLHWRIK